MGILTLLVQAATFGVFALAIYLAIAVQHDAAVRIRSKKGVFLVGHWAWFFIVILSGGFLGAFAYWVIHYSSFRYVPEADE